VEVTIKRKTVGSKGLVFVLHTFQMLLFKASSNQVLETECMLAIHYTGCDN